MKFNVGRLGIDVNLSWNETVLTVPVVPSSPQVNNTPVLMQPGATISGVSENVVPSGTNLLDETRRVAYTITSSFEGGPVGRINFENISGNFDGMAVSFGVFQWCIGQSSDIKLWKRLESVHPGVLKASFGEALYREFMFYLDKPLAVRLSWAQKAMNTSGNKIDPVWMSAYRKLCTDPAWKEVQLFYMEPMFQRALSMCKEYGLRSSRSVALMVDIICQNGSIKAATKAEILANKAAKERALGRALTEVELMEIISIKRAAASNPRWASDVLSRKMCITRGKGVVHSTTFDLSKLGLTDQIVL